MIRKLMLTAATLVLSISAHAGSARLTTDVVDTAVGSGSFNTLVAAVSAAGLVDALKADGPITVFAPTDDAFAKLPAGTVDALLKDIPALSNILTYHVAAGELSPKNLLISGSSTTLQGQNLAVRFKRGSLYVNKSKVLDVIYVRNGVIYVIDSVLLPK